jgi:hypothetical protein
MLNLQNSEFKTVDQLKSICNSIFTEQGSEGTSEKYSHISTYKVIQDMELLICNSIFTEQGSEGTSEKYSHISTYKVIQDMELLGWGVVDAKQVKARKNIGYQKHLVVFRNPDVVINGADGDQVFPQILLTNSHDGKNSFTFTPGLFRMICENGLVVATEQFADFRVRHMGYDFEALQSTIHSIVESLPLTVESMNKMKAIILEEESMFELAKELLDIRMVGTDNTYEALNVQKTEEMIYGQFLTVFKRTLWKEIFHTVP